MRDDALNVVLETLNALDEGSQIPERSRRWLQDGLVRFLDGESLHSALCLNHRDGQTPVYRQYRLAIRNHYLRVAWMQLQGKPWPRAGELEKHVARFSCRVWPRVRDRAVPPPHFDELDCALFAAFAVNGVERMPASARQLSKIASEPNPPLLISKKYSYDFHDRQ